MFRSKRFQIVELIVSAAVTGNNSDIYFQNQPQLQSISGGRQVFVEAIEAYTVNDLALSPITSGNAVASGAALRNATLTLSVDTNYNFLKLPLASLHRLYSVQAGGLSDSTARDLFQVNQIWQIDWTKSYITCVGAPASAPFSYLLGVHYRYSTDEEPVALNSLYTKQLELESRLDQLTRRVVG